jgi:hypothetical protein
MNALFSCADTRQPIHEQVAVAYAQILNDLKQSVKAAGVRAQKESDETELCG